MAPRSLWRSAWASVDWRFVAAWFTTLTIIWVAYAFAHRAIVDSMERDLQERIETDMLVLEDHASRAMDGVVSSLEAVAALSDSKELADRARFSRQLRDLLFDDTIVRSLSLVDAQGFVIVSSNLSNIGQKVTLAVLDGLGPAPTQPRKGVRFTGSLAQRDLADQPIASSPDAQPIWLGQIDARSSALTSHRWVATINSGFFQNFWSAATRRKDFKVGLFDYEGQRLVSLGEGPAASLVAQGLQQSLRVRESGAVESKELSDRLIRYRASTRHPLAFTMFVDRASQVQEQLDRTSALRLSAVVGSFLASIVIGLFYLSSHRYHQFAWANKQLRQQAFTDGLTGLANRRAFDELVPQEIKRAGSLGLPLALMVMDLDHFKRINDRFGHPAGDAVLKEMAKRWQALLRSQDLIARIGGEEFCVVLPGAGPRQAEAVALKLIEATRRETVASGLGLQLPVTASIGLIAFDTCPSDSDAEQLLGTADCALYRAKESGRNRVVMASLRGEHGERITFRHFAATKKEADPINDFGWLQPDANSAAER